MGEGEGGGAFLVKRISLFARDLRDMREKRDWRNGQRFEVRSARFLERRTLNFESRFSRVPRFSRQSRAQQSFSAVC